MPRGQCLRRGRHTYHVRCHKADSLPNLHRKVYRSAKPPGGLQPSCLTPHCTLEVLQRPYPNPMSRLRSREGKGGKTNYSTRQCHPVGDNACAEACTPAVPVRDNAAERQCLDSLLTMPRRTMPQPQHRRLGWEPNDNAAKRQQCHRPSRRAASLGHTLLLLA